MARSAGMDFSSNSRASTPASSRASSSRAAGSTLTVDTSDCEPVLSEPLSNAFSPGMALLEMRGILTSASDLRRGMSENSDFSAALDQETDDRSEEGCASRNGDEHDPGEGPGALGEEPPDDATTRQERRRHGGGDERQKAAEATMEHILELQQAAFRETVKKHQWVWWLTSGVVVGVPLASSGGISAKDALDAFSAGMHSVSLDWDRGDLLVWLLVVFTTVASILAGVLRARGRARAAAFTEYVLHGLWAAMPFLALASCASRGTSLCIEAAAADTVMRLGALGGVAWTPIALDHLSEVGFFVVVCALCIGDVIYGLWPIGMSLSFNVTGSERFAETSESGGLLRRQAAVYMAMGANYGAMPWQGHGGVRCLVPPPITAKTSVPAWLRLDDEGLARTGLGGVGRFASHAGPGSAI